MSLYIRRTGFRATKKLFLIASEGAETEPCYFEALKHRVSRDSIIRVKLVASPKHKSHPKEVLKRLQAAAKNENIKRGDELWLIIDRDAWESTDLDMVCRKAKELGYFVGLSNPCFELWLYLHLRDNRDFNDRHQCQQEFGKYCKSYALKGKSGYDPEDLIGGIEPAIDRARKLNVRPDDPWPRTQSTRVYLLVEKLLKGVMP
jgi:hypothetical protein